VRLRGRLVDGQPVPGRDQLGHRPSDVGIEIVPHDDDGAGELLARGVQKPGATGVGEALTSGLGSPTWL
jgi:hypothetical protein